MLQMGYGAEHEQYQPLPLLGYAVEAERAGFDTIWTSDHFHPWAHTNAAGGFAWTWMAAAAERTRRMEIGTTATCPTMRYNPAIVAQAFATLRAMYPGRIFTGVGTSEAMNEVPVGYHWPSFRERVERLEEAIKVMNLLWSDSFVNFKGKYYGLRKTNLSTKPTSPPPLFVAASGPTVAEMAGRLADGLLTVVHPEQHYHNILFPALERGAKSAGRDPGKITKALEIWVSYDQDCEKAFLSARFWAATLLPAMLKYEIIDPREIEQHGDFVGDKQLAQYWLIGTKPEDHIRHLEKYIKLGFQDIHIQSSSPNEIATLRMYGKEVLPYMRSIYGK